MIIIVGYIWIKVGLIKKLDLNHEHVDLKSYMIGFWWLFNPKFMEMSSKVPYPNVHHQGFCEVFLNTIKPFWE